MCLWFCSFFSFTKVYNATVVQFEQVISVELGDAVSPPAIVGAVTEVVEG